MSSLPPSSRRVAQALLEDPQLAMNATISELANRCKTSETSVVRFCRSIGFSGYPELRIAMAAEVGREQAQIPDDARYGSDIGTDDSLADAINKVAFSEKVGIQETLESIELDELAAIIAAIGSATRVIVFGVGASNLVAHDLQAKLLRIGRTAIAVSDAHDAMVLAALTDGTDVVVGLSHSGATRETVEFLRLAQKHGATTVGITNARSSPLVEHCDHVLYTAVRETTFRSGAMASRTAQLMLVDCIFVGVAQRSFDRTIHALKATREGVDPLRSGR